MSALLKRLRDLRLAIENFHLQYLSKRQGGLRWYKAELTAARSEYYRLEERLKARDALVDSLLAQDRHHPLKTAEKLLRMVEEVVVNPVLRGEALQNYEVRCWRDDYMQFKINVLHQQPVSEQDLLCSTHDGSIKVYRTRTKNQ